jgi:hypothetical protein
MFLVGCLWTHRSVFVTVCCATVVKCLLANQSYCRRPARMSNHAGYRVGGPATDALYAAVLSVQIRTAMVTGDHVRTAVSVAHQCNILPEGRPVLLMDAAPAGQPVDACPVALSVLYPDGSVNATVTRAAVLPQVSAATCLVLFCHMHSTVPHSSTHVQLQLAPCRLHFVEQRRQLGVC